MKQLPIYHSQQYKLFYYLFLKSLLVLIVLPLLFSWNTVTAQTNNSSDGTELANLGLSVIPYPQNVTLQGDDFILGRKVTIVLD